METSLPTYSIRLAELGDVASLPGIERAAASRFVEVGYPDLADRPVTGLSSLIEAQREERLWVAIAGSPGRPSPRKPWTAGEDPEEAPVGFALVRPVDGQPHIHEMDVHPVHGQRGLGRALAIKVIEQAKEQGFERVTLVTFRDVPWNAPFYQKLGFRELPKKEHGPELQGLLDEETETGMPTETRLTMIFHLDGH